MRSRACMVVRAKPSLEIFNIDKGRTPPLDVSSVWYYMLKMLLTRI